MIYLKKKAMKNNGIIYFILIPVVLVIAFLLNSSHLNSEKKEINEWVVKHNYEHIKSEWQFTIFGSPYNYLHKGEYVFKVNVIDSLNNSKTLWVRTNAWGENDYEFDK